MVSNFWYITLGLALIPVVGSAQTVAETAKDGVTAPPVVMVGGKPFSYGPVRALQNTGIKIGDAPFNGQIIYTESGQAVDIGELIASSEYTVLTGACLTCGAFINSFAGIEALERDYSDKGIQFLYLYRILSHPERNDYIQPFTIEERLMHVAEAKNLLRVKIPFIADNMDNSIRLTWGNIPNPAFILDSEGRVVYMAAWADPELVRPELVNLVGPVNKPTTVADLDIKKDYKFNLEPGDVTVPLIVTPDTMYPLKLTPQPSDHPFFAKLRAEVEPQVLEGQPGKLYLGFRMDAMYPVGWNNLAEPVEVRVDTSAGVTVTPNLVYGPDPNVVKDKSPREFLLDIAPGQDHNKSFSVTINYYACDDADVWCIPINQQYFVQLEFNPTGGKVEQRFWKAQRQKTNPNFNLEEFTSDGS